MYVCTHTHRIIEIRDYLFKDERKFFGLFFLLLLPSFLLSLTVTPGLLPLPSSLFRPLLLLFVLLVLLARLPLFLFSKKKTDRVAEHLSTNFKIFRVLSDVPTHTHTAIDFQDQQTIVRDHKI